jgi:D-inositol-3-phosphate glycosyltransferase
VPPVPATELAVWDAAASVVAVPSYNESFGLVAAEALATGTPVVAAAVGGLPTAVADDVSGVLVDGHNPQHWAKVLDDLLRTPRVLGRLADGARNHAAQFSWERTADGLVLAYREAMEELHERKPAER